MARELAVPGGIPSRAIPVGDSRGPPEIPSRDVATAVAPIRDRDRATRNSRLRYAKWRTSVIGQVAERAARETDEYGDEIGRASTRANLHCSGRECVTVLRASFSVNTDAGQD